MALVTLAEAKGHLEVTDDSRNSDIQAKVEEASAIVLTHLKSQAVAGWSDGSVAVPGDVKAATKLMLGYLDKDRGDDPTVHAATWLSVERILVGWRDPTLA